MSAIAIRPESPDDAAAIHAVIEAAFLGMPFADGDEQHLPARLREDGDLALSLVAEDAERIVGHIAFSPVTIAGGATGWYGLAPLSVLPELHGQGIGSALAKRGIADMQARGVTRWEPSWLAFAWLAPLFGRAASQWAHLPVNLIAAIALLALAARRAALLDAAFARPLPAPQRQ